MVNELKNKTVVIAGAASGAGLELARIAASSGANVHLLGRSAERLQKASHSLHRSVWTHTVDIGAENEVAHFASGIAWSITWSQPRRT
jgi:NADP-dependent 3-hydroxy acid dehydrogenase YdfG